MKAPESWRLEPLSWGVETLESGISENGIDRAAKTGEPAVLRVSAVTSGTFLPESCKVLPSPIGPKLRTPVRGDCVLINRANGSANLVGISVYVPKPHPDRFLPDKIWQITAKKDRSCARYLGIVTSTPRFREAVLNESSGGTGMRNIGSTRYLGIEVAFPPLHEQQKIADILSTWDEALEKLDALIAAKERNYLATLERLLRAFDATQIKVNEVTSESGPRNRAKIVSRVLSVTNTKGFVLSKDYFDRQVASSDTSSYKIVRRGEFAYNPSRINVGSIARLDDWNEGLVSPIYVVFALNNRIEPDYFYHWLNSHEARSRIRRSAQGSVRDSVNFDDFGSIRLPLPKRSKQKAISEYLNIAQRELRLLRDQRAAVDQQKRGLMQKLLTGKVRVST